MEASSTMVIKVKYENVLRRFNNPIVDEKPFLNMDGLREKIVTLFSFAPDTDLLLTYVDEDGDEVALVDDDDLRDVVKQGLNPLRVTVKVTDDKNGNQNHLNASSTPLKSAHAHRPPNPSASVSEILTKVPEPLFETLLKLSDDLAAKGSLSSSSISELVDNLSKVSSSLLGQQLSDSGVTLNMQNGAPASSSTADHKVAEPLKVKSSSILQKVKPATNMKRKVTKIQNVTGHKEEDPSFDFSVVAEALESQNVNVYKPASVGVPHTLCRNEKGKKTVECSNGNSNVGKVGKFCVTSSNLPSQVNTKPTGNDICNSTEPKLGSNSTCDGSSYLMNGDHVIARKTSGLRDALENAPASTWSPYNGGLNFGAPRGTGLIYESPFSGTLENVSVAPLHRAFDAVPLWSNSQNDSSGGILHHGVCCDGCGTDPIVGLWFKSKVMVNYDLCHNCFQKMGNHNDYILMDRSAAYQHHLPHFRAREQGEVFPYGYRVSKGQLGAVKLDSRFIKDVNIFDGTVMAPLTTFTKIWRMRNNGTVAWPQKTQLFWIGGDKLTETQSVEIQIPAGGLLMGQELDVAVDFISPELPGRYISYWRMASPSGAKFGQRVWVLIQVDPCNDETPKDIFRNLNLNLPPASSGPEIIPVDPAPVAVVESRFPIPNAGDSKNELKFPINDSLLFGNGSGSGASSSSSSSSSAPPTSSSSSPFVLFPDTASHVPFTLVPPPPMPMAPPPFSMHPSNGIPLSSFYSSNALPNPPFQASFPASAAMRSPMAESPPPTDAVAELPAKDVIEDKLLRKLKEMGFKQVNLNKEVLRMNEYDLEAAVDDLCGVAEWDPILEELNEMGFHETEMNRILLKKNKGSIKRVVMDLIAGEQSSFSMMNDE